MSESRWIKICGVRDVVSARVAEQAGADAIGINFYQPSSRFIGSLDRARQVIHSLDGLVRPVGLFVNHPLEVIVEICRSTGIDLVQLHGDETSARIAELHRRAPQLEIIWARRVQPSEIPDLEAGFRQLREAQTPLFACLLDAQVPGQFGGTGTPLPWREVATMYQKSDWPRMILAGGLDPTNVVEALATANPWGVDVAGGVESAPGVKSETAIREFVANARGHGLYSG